MAGDVFIRISAVPVDEIRPTMSSQPINSMSHFKKDLSLVDNLLISIEELVLEAERQGEPLEIDPWRERLFEMFVTAHGAGYLEGHDEGDEIIGRNTTPDLTADSLCRQLGDRWGLANAARESVAQQQKLPTEDLGKMRLLWSLMRMWMEWTYAWKRWPEFNDHQIS